MAIVTVGMAVKVSGGDKSEHWGSLRLEPEAGGWTTVPLSADEARLLASELLALADRLDPPKAATE